MQCACGHDMQKGAEYYDENGVLVREWSCPECLHTRTQEIRSPTDKKHRLWPPLR